MQNIHILGVSHIKPNLGKTVALLNTLEINEETVVFIEPKKNILTGSEVCTSDSIATFFAKIVAHTMAKKASIVPLNPSKMPSHKSNFLYEKYAKQFAEEEYMVEVIANAKNTKGIVIIGDIHAERMKNLLNNKGINVTYSCAAPNTPDDVIAKSWRNAIEGKTNEFVDLSWLEEINMKTSDELQLPKEVNPQVACWDDEELYKKYLEAVQKNMERFAPSTIEITTVMRNDTYQAKKEGSHILENYKSHEDHPVMSFPYPEIQFSSHKN